MCSSKYTPVGVIAVRRSLSTWSLAPPRLRRSPTSVASAAGSAFGFSVTRVDAPAAGVRLLFRRRRSGGDGIPRRPLSRLCGGCTLLRALVRPPEGTPRPFGPRQPKPRPANVNEAAIGRRGRGDRRAAEEEEEEEET
ncbi:hypothetical protein EYF80_066454 [Liparis tanakae]|uniref:Uncharacterized protein n=1 Tax=Liparis tanakae TaxID=230148 RepID=A0A4Z2E3S3_9TELE|nr:hypothetical protein EYF80_066454 [Liparis tanakae]